MRVLPVDAVVGNEYAAPFALNAELREVVGRANRLDRWAFAAALPHSKIRVGAFGIGPSVTGTSTLRTINIGALPVGSSQPVVSLVPVPDGAGNPMRVPITTRGGILSIALNVVVNKPGAFYTLIWYRVIVFVDGEKAAVSPLSARDAIGDSLLVHCEHPVGAGPHIVEPYLELWSVNTAADTLDFLDRSLALSEYCR